VLCQRDVIGQDSPAHEHLKVMKAFVGEWVSESKVPPDRPEVGEEGTTMVLHLSWRWMLNRDFMVGNFKRQVGEKTELGKEIAGWDAKVRPACSLAVLGRRTSRQGRVVR
jgi:hypothetical protein